MIKSIMICCLAMALVAALGYFLMGIGVIHVPDQPLNDTSSGRGAPPGFDWIMFGCYVIGSLLILLRNRRLWIAGAVLNAIPIVGFYAMWASRTDVMFSAPGLLTKIPQILLEAALIYLIVKSRPEKSAVTAK
jgi:hypothetical protein